MLRNTLFAGLAVLAFIATPALGKDGLIDADSGPVPVAQSSVDGGNGAETLSESSFAPITDPAMAMAAASNASDTLANFGPSSGTVVATRNLELRDEVVRLRSSVNLNSNEFSILHSSGVAGAVLYHSTVAAITARLQNGTTHGNPILLRQWEEADASLGEASTSLNRLNSLQTSIEADAALAAYLLESIQAAFQLSGAVDEDHDQLKLLRDEVSRLVVQLDYLRNQTADDIQRQTAYLSAERANLQALSFAISRGELLGNSLANRQVIVAGPPLASMPSATSANASGSFAPPPQAAPTSRVIAGVSSGPQPMSPREYMKESSVAAAAPPMTDSGVAPNIGRLLVLIRYNQPNVEYEQQLSQAVGTALERHPNAEFSVVAVSPASGDSMEIAKSQQEAQDNAEAVKRSLVQLGLAPSRISMANTQAQSAQTPEVHVYVR